MDKNKDLDFKNNESINEDTSQNISEEKDLINDELNTEVQGEVESKQVFESSKDDQEDIDYMDQMESMIEEEIQKKEEKESEIKTENKKGKVEKIKKPKFLQKQEVQEVKVEEPEEEVFEGTLEDLAKLQKEETKKKETDIKKSNKEKIKKEKSKKEKKLDSDDGGKEEGSSKTLNLKLVVPIAIGLVVIILSIIIIPKLLPEKDVDKVDIVENIDNKIEDIDNTIVENTEDIIDEKEIDEEDEEEVLVEEEVTDEIEDQDNEEEVLKEALLEIGILKQLAETQAVIEVDNSLRIFEIEENVYNTLKDIAINDEIYFETIDESIVNIYIIDDLDLEETEDTDITELTEEDIDDFFQDIFDEGEQALGTDIFFELFKDDFEEELKFIREREIQDTFEAIEEERRNQEQELVLQSKSETIEYPMQVKGNGNLWFRFAWKPNDTTPSVARIDDVLIELKNNNGTLITPSNIDKYGRYWVENNVVNFAIRNGQQGKWSFVVTKKVKDKLGEIGANVVPMEGFIEIQKFAIKAQRDKLLTVWKVGGMKDDDLAVQIYARRNNQDTLIYSANSADDTLYPLDRAEINTSKLPKGKYDIVFKVQDIKVGKNERGQSIITQRYITDEYIIPDVEVY